MHVRSENVWADRIRVGPVEVRQLLVSAGEFEVVERDGRTWLDAATGRWPALRAGQSNFEPTTVLTARLPRHVPDHGGRVDQWIGSKRLVEPYEVVQTYHGALRLDPGHVGLRRAQRGALYSVLGYWESGVKEPALVVMPTGTGKTDTMIALMVAMQPELLLVIVPTAALRDQIAGAFEHLGVLQEVAVVAPTAARPAVTRLDHGLQDAGQAEAVTSASNVVVATPTALDACGAEARAVLLARASHLMVDEAHHSAAVRWAAVIDSFVDRPVVLFTATPFREDGQALKGRPIYRFPLREAQREGYFTRIDHRAVLSLDGTDQAVAELAVARLDQDLAAGYDHLLMARVSSVRAARELETLYRGLAPHHGARAIYDKLPASTRRLILADLRAKRSRIVVCVDMLGEGFDLPELKIAAIHDPRRSVSPMLQFIGRFVRTSAKTAVGTASVFIARDPALAHTPMRALLREDADWNDILRDITDRAGETVEELDTFEASFRGVPDGVPVTLLRPTMSAIAHRAPSDQWRPERAVEVFGAKHVVGGEVAVGGPPGPGGGTVAWLIVETISTVRWADAGPELKETDYELILMRFDPRTRVLCIHGSGKKSGYAELAQAVLGEAAEPIKGTITFRVLSGIDRLLPNNVGLLDARNQFTRYSMHVGSDVAAALETAEAHGRTQTHIATSGFSEGESVTICASLAGRFWSVRSTLNIKQWSDWCAGQIPKLLDDTIHLPEVFANFIIPEDLSERPDLVLLGVEWPWELYLRTGDGPWVSVDDTAVLATDVDLVVEDHSREGPLRFAFETDAWSISYRGEFLPGIGLTYTPVGVDATITSGREDLPLREWLNRHKPLLFLEGDHVIDEHDRLLSPRDDLPPFDRSRFIVLDWDGVDIRRESQGPERRQDTVQAFMSRHLRDTQALTVLIDDDRAGEAADLVGLHVDQRELTVTLVHCKFSHEDKPGGRLADLYELCGQAVRGARWRQNGAVPLLRHLQRRAEDYARRTGVSPFDVGTYDDLVRLREIAPQRRVRFRTVLAQPGLSQAAATTEQLRLLAGAEAYLRASTHGTFDLITSP